MIYESELIAYVGRQAAVAPVVARRDGGWFSMVNAPEGPRILQVFQAAPGAKPTEISAQLYHQVGRALGALHCAQDCPPRCGRQ